MRSEPLAGLERERVRQVGSCSLLLSVRGWEGVSWSCPLVGRGSSLEFDTSGWPDVSSARDAHYRRVQLT